VILNEFLKIKATIINRVSSTNVNAYTNTTINTNDNTNVNTNDDNKNDNTNVNKNVTENIIKNEDNNTANNTSNINTTTTTKINTTNTTTSNFTHNHKALKNFLEEIIFSINYILSLKNKFIITIECSQSLNEINNYIRDFNFSSIRLSYKSSKTSSNTNIKIINYCSIIFYLVEKLKNVKDSYVLILSSVFNNFNLTITEYNGSLNKFLIPNKDKTRLILDFIEKVNELKLEYFNNKINCIYIKPSRNLNNVDKNEEGDEGDQNDGDACLIGQNDLISIDTLKINEETFKKISLVNFEELYCYHLYFFKNFYKTLSKLTKFNSNRRNSVDSNYFKKGSKTIKKSTKLNYLFQFNNTSYDKTVDKTLKFYFDIIAIIIRRFYFNKLNSAKEVCRICEEKFIIRNFTNHIYFCFEKKLILKILRTVKTNLIKVYKKCENYIDFVESNISSESKKYIHAYIFIIN